MIALLARLMLLPAFIITGWFLEENAVNFSTVQMTVALVLFGLAVAGVAFWQFGGKRKPARLSRAGESVREETQSEH